MKAINISKFDNGWYKPASKIRIIFWYFTSMFMFKTLFPIPSSIKVKVLRLFGAKIYQNAWINYALQFQWGLDNCSITTEWVMRMGADEHILPELEDEIEKKSKDLNLALKDTLIKEYGCEL